MSKNEIKKESEATKIVDRLELNIKLCKLSNRKTFDKLKWLQIRIIDCYDLIDGWLAKYPRG